MSKCPASVIPTSCRCAVAVCWSWGPKYPSDVDKCHPPGLQNELSQCWGPLVQGGCLCSHPHGACRYSSISIIRKTSFHTTCPRGNWQSFRLALSCQWPVQQDSCSPGEVTELIPLGEAMMLWVRDEKKRDRQRWWKKMYQCVFITILERKYTVSENRRCLI